MWERSKTTLKETSWRSSTCGNSTDEILEILK